MRDDPAGFRRLALAGVALASLGAGPSVPPAAAADGDAATLVPPPAAHTFGFRRVTRRELALVMPGTSLVSPGGVAVTRLASTDDAGTRDDDDEVTVVAADTGGNAIFTSFGLTRAARWDGKGTAVGPLSAPADVALDRAGLLAVSDTGNRRVVILRHDGKSLTPLRAHEGFGEPLGIAADGAGGFLVCDRAADAVVRLDAETGRRTTFGLEAAFSRPVDVATVAEGDRLAAGHKRTVVVADRDGRRLRSFDPAGALRAARDAGTLAAAAASFDDVDIDYHGNVFAVDRKANRIHKLREDLFPLDTFGTRGTSPGQFLGPRGIAIHRRFGQVFVTEEDGGQYLWIGTDVRDARARNEDGGIRLDYLLTEESLVEVRVLDARGGTVARLVEEARQGAGPHAGFWDGTNAEGARVAAGTYTIDIAARATYASRSSFERRRQITVRLPAAGARP